MALDSNLHNRMLGWQDRVFKLTPTVPQIKRAWQDKQYASLVFLCGMKKGMDAAYEGIRKVWIDGVVKAGDYIVGTGGKQEGIWFTNVLQTDGIWKYKNQIPKSIRVAQDYWNTGELWQALYLAGVRRGWITVYEIYVGQWGEKWFQNQGFPD